MGLSRAENEIFVHASTKGFSSRIEAKSNWKILNASSSGNVAIVSNSRATNVFPLSSLLSGCDASANLSATKDHPETRNFDEKFVVPRLLQTCRPMFK